MMKPGKELAKAYRLMADYRKEMDECETVGYSEGVDYYHYKLNGVQKTLEVLTGEWPVALHSVRDITIYHGTYEQTFAL